MNKRRVTFWVLLIVFAVLVVAWFFYVPYRPSDLYRVLPPNAVFVSHHHRLAERWDDFLANPLARALFTSVGLDPQDLDEWSDDPDIRFWADKLLTRDLLIAHVPALGPGRDPAWVLAGWIGGESTRLRWLLQRGKLRGFEMVPRNTGGAYWLVELEDEHDQYLSISVVEGMLIGAFSDDPHAVRHILDVYDGMAPGHPVLRDNAWPMSAGAEGVDPDRGWFEGLTERGTDTTYQFGFRQIDQHGIRGSIRRPESGTLPVISASDIEVPSRLFGPVPFVMLGLNPDAVRNEWLEELGAPAQAVIDGIFETGAAEVLFLAVSGGEYAGTLVGISVPSLMAAWPVDDEMEALARAHALIDRLNAVFRWGLVVTETRADERTVHVIEGTADNAYAGFRFRERVAFTFVDGWAVLSSHAYPLMKLLGRYDRPEALVEADQGGWQREIRRGDVAAYGRVNIRGGARTLRLAISAYSVKLLFEDPRGSRETRQRLNETRAWLDTLEPMGGADLWLDQGDGWLQVQFALGDKKEEEQE